MTPPGRISAVLLSFALLALCLNQGINQVEAADYAITVQGNVFNATGTPAPIGTPVNISIYDGVVLSAQYSAQILDSNGFYYNDNVYADYGNVISVNASFGGFQDEGNAIVYFGKASYEINLGMGYGVSVTPPADVNSDPGLTITHTFNVTNSGKVNDRYILSSYSFLGWGLPIASSMTAILRPGEYETVDVDVAVPSDAIAYVQEILTLEAVSTSNATVVSNASVITTVNQIAGVEVMEPPAGLAAPGETLNLTFEVKNLGNWLDTYQLEASSSNPTWNHSIIGANVTGIVDIDSSVSVNVSTTVPLNADPNNSTIITLKATSLFNSSEFDEKPVIVATFQVAGAKVTAPTGLITGLPGETLNLTFQVRNMGNDNDTFHLIVTSTDPSWEVTINSSAITQLLARGDSVNIEILVTVPAGANVLNHTVISLIATSEFDLLVFGTGSVIINTSQFAGVVVTPPSAGVVGAGDTISITLQVQNLGNGDDTFLLAVTSSNPSWTISLNVPTNNISVGIGSSANVEVSVKAPVGTGTNNHTEVTLEATSGFDSHISDIGSAIFTAQFAEIDVIAPAETQVGRAGDLAYIIFQVNNTGNILDTYNYELYVSTGWSYNLPENTTLDVGESVNIPVVIAIQPTATYGESAMVTLTAISTFNSSIKDSDPTLLYVIENQLPTAVIDSPLHESEYSIDQVITFDASSSTDPENDTLTYNWTSSIDGSIGEGRIVNSTLTEGNHTVTLTVTDGHGGKDTERIIVIVTSDELPADKGFLQEYWWILLIFILIILIGLLFLKYQKKEKKWSWEREEGEEKQ